MLSSSRVRSHRRPERAPPGRAEGHRGARSHAPAGARACRPKRSYARARQATRGS